MIRFKKENRNHIKDFKYVNVVSDWQLFDTGLQIPSPSPVEARGCEPFDTVDILEKKRESNKGQVPKYYVEDSHESIIPKDIFLKVQEEISRRANLTKGTTQHKRVYSGRF